MTPLLRCGLCSLALAAAQPLARGAFIANGSLEDFGTWSDTIANYMAIGAGSTAISGWTVAPATTGNLVWAKTPTGDGYSASDGTYFVDLTGFGASSPNGKLEQLLTGLVSGGMYSFSFDTFGTAAGVSVDGSALSLTAGSTFTVGTTSWTTRTGTFVAGGSTALLSIGNVVPGASVVFVDHIVVDGPSASTGVPDSTPTGSLLAAVGLAGGFLKRRRRG